MVDGEYGVLDVINSGSCTELDEKTIEYLSKTIEEKNIHTLWLESHYMYAPRLDEFARIFPCHVKFRTGIESFNPALRKAWNKGIPDSVTPEDVGRHFSGVCLLAGIRGETKEDILSQVNDAITKAQKRNPAIKARAYIAKGSADCYTGEKIEAERYFPAWVTSLDDPFVRKAIKGLEKAGIDAPISHFSFCTNGSHYAGEAGIPAIGYGPSLESLAHVRDEYIEIDQLVKAVNGFISILKELTA